MNFKVKSLSSVGLLALLVIMLPYAARADDFTFSFTNTVGSTPGTVTGEIFGLSNNGTGAATDVTVTSYPASAATAHLPAAPIDLFTGPWFIGGNSFTESGGAITAYSFNAEGGGDVLDIALFTLSSSASPTGSLQDNARGLVFYSILGPVDFAPVVATPEPSSISLMLIGLVALGTLAAVSTRKPLGESLVS